MEQANNILQTGEPISQTAASTAPISSTPQTSPIAPNQPTAPTNESWRTILSILLIIFLGPIGIIVMWIVARWPKWIKCLITAVVIIPLILLLIVAISFTKSINKYVDQRIEWSENPNNSIADHPLFQGLNSEQKKKLQTADRDMKIREDIAEWKVALAIYQSNNGLYPKCPSQKPSCFIKELNLTGDPTLNLEDNNDYLYWFNGDDYKIQFQLEKKIDQFDKGIYCETSKNSTQGACL